MYRIPVPYLKLTNDFKILDVSKSVTHLFHPVSSFLDLVDAESQYKFRQISHIPSPGTMEVNLKTVDSPTTLFTIHFNHQVKEKIIHIVCMNTSSAYDSVSMEFQELRQQIQAGEWLDLLPSSTQEVAPTPLSKKEAERKIATINDLLGIIKHDLDKSGKIEYVNLIQSELDDIKQYLNS